MNSRFCLSLLALIFLLNTTLSAQSRLDTIPSFDSLPYPEAQQYAQVLLARAQSLEQFFTEKASQAATARAKAEEQVVFAKADTTFNKDSLKTLTTTLKNAKVEERGTARQQKQAAKVHAFAAEVALMDTLPLRKNLPKVRAQVNELDRLAHPPPPAAPDTNAVATAAPEKKKKEKPVSPTQRFKPYDPNADVMLHPPAKPCALAADTRDEFSGEVHRETARELLFQYTPPPLRALRTDGQPYISAEAALSSAGTGLSLNLSFTIRDPNARKAFGNLPRGGIAILKFMDGSTFTLNNQRSDEGTFDQATQIAVYRGQYSFDRTVLRKMQKSELDKIRIAWATGYEDYDVLFVDALMREAECIGK